MVTAFACEWRLVLAQAAVTAGKQNEILNARTVLELFDIKGMLVPADALHCNVNTARLIVGRGADSPIAPKGNRPSMLAAVQRLFASPPS